MDSISTEIPIHYIVEGPTDQAVAKRLLTHVGLIPGYPYGMKGKDYLLAHLPNYNQAARHCVWFGMIDLDNDAQCPSHAIAQWLPSKEAGMLLRVVVRSVEAWLMADRERMAAFLYVSPSLFPDNPDIEVNPKEKLVNIARRSTSNDIRNQFVPRQRSGARVGPLYATRLNEFAEKHWRPEEAMLRSDSLRRCINALVAVKENNIWEW